jgi:hypothetical protein
VVARDNPSIRLGWRFAVGVVLIVGGYAAWSLIPVAVATDLHPGAKSAYGALGCNAVSDQSRCRRPHGPAGL